MSQIYGRKALPVVIVALTFLVTGCATYGYDDIFRNPVPGNHRFDVNRDVNRYVAQVDRRVRLNRRDAQFITRLLRDRTYRLLDRTRSADHRYVYPFPRRDYRNMNRAQYDFWTEADRSIERNLPRVQARRYADMTRGRDNRDYRRADRTETRRDRRNRGRYDDRRYENRQYDDDN